MRTGRASRTAQENALFRALDARRPVPKRIADDRLAVHFLPPEFRLLAEIARVGAVRRTIEEVIDRRWPGPRPGVVMRTRLIDDMLTDAIADVTQVLILGAGFDTRAYRLPVLAAIPVFEVDHPSTQGTKRRRVIGAIGSIPGNVTFVPVEFGRDDPIAEITSAGFLEGRRTLVLWEGVTNYLTAEAVDETFRSVGGVIGQGSPVIFTYIDRRMLDGTATFEGASRSSAHVRSVGEPYTFGFDPAEVAGYLAERGYALVSDETVQEASRRYTRDGRGSSGYGYYHVAEARRG